MNRYRPAIRAAALALCVGLTSFSPAGAPPPLRVFIFAGQSNMVGADSDAADIDLFPPFEGLGSAGDDVLFHHCIGREDKALSDGWTTLAPVRGKVGPELSFARMVTAHTEGPIAIIKVAAGGTTLAEDWDPESPEGFELYPLALDRVRTALAALDEERTPHRLEAFVWHQGENDMLTPEHLPEYAANLGAFMARWRRDLDAPELPFLVGGHCTGTIWGMDHRREMHAIDRAQREAVGADPHATFVPTTHLSVRVGRGTGLHYHYGTLGQLQHGEAHARAYLRSQGIEPEPTRTLKRWPHREGSRVTLFVALGHRNMEGERAFAAHIESLRGRARSIGKDDHSVPLRVHCGGGARVSADWEPMGPTGISGTFGPELAFSARLKRAHRGPVAVVKVTAPCSQLADWTPDPGDGCPDRAVFAEAMGFVQDAVRDLEARGHDVELGAVLYHVAENDMAWGPARRRAPERLAALIAGTREALGAPGLPWLISQQAPPDHDRVRELDAMGPIRALIEADPHVHHVEAKDLDGGGMAMVMDAAAVVTLGERFAAAWLKLTR